MKRLIVLLAVATIAGCSGGGHGSLIPLAPVGSSGLPSVIDRATTACAVTADGLLWYAVPAGGFSPMVAQQARCSGLQASASPAIPNWARPSGSTQAIFVATSFQQNYSLAGMESIEAAAAPHHVPVTWMIDNSQYLANASLYDEYHTANGDDVQANADPGLVDAVKATFSWYVPTVATEGAAAQRNIGIIPSLGMSAFWGITWNSHGVDLTADEGAPWGTYCADPTSYKRPASDGTCALLAFEWTARDLTRAYVSGHEEDFSTDPDDLLLRGGFSLGDAQTYERSLVDAYAAAGANAPLVMMSQQESAEDTNPGDPQVLDALYARAVADGMKVETLTQSAADARRFSGAPRAIAFPFILGGSQLPSLLDGGSLYPATIDYHDAQVGMTFVAGQAMPTRAFVYADDPTSVYNVPLASLAPMPTITTLTASNGAISIQIQATRAMRFGVAIWADPATLGLTGSGVVPAGHAGAVLTFDLNPGTNQHTFPCAACNGAPFVYST